MRRKQQKRLAPGMASCSFSSARLRARRLRFPHSGPGKGDSCRMLEVQNCRGNLQLLTVSCGVGPYLMGSQAEMVRGSKPVSPTQVPSKAGVSGRPAKGMAVTPLPWSFPSPKSCIEVCVEAAALLPGCEEDSTSLILVRGLQMQGSVCKVWTA